MTQKAAAGPVAGERRLSGGEFGRSKVCLGLASINRESDPDGGELTPEMSFLACLAHRAEFLENR